MNTIIMIGITFYLLSSHFLNLNANKDIRLAKTLYSMKNIFLGLQEPPDSSRFLFVDTAWEKQFIDKNELIISEPDTMIEERDTIVIPADTFEFPIGQEVITNRQSLATFFEILAQKPDNHKFILCKIYLKGFSEYDSLLLASINKLPNLIFPYHFNGWGTLDYPDLAIPEEKLGLSEIGKIRELSMRTSLFVDGDLKTIPLIMYEKIHKKEVKPGFIFDYIDGQSVLNSFTLDYRIRTFQYDNSDRYSKVYLGDLMTSSPKFIHELTKDKIILIGDLDSSNWVDLHESFYGDTKGILILLNAFLALEAGDNIITWYFLVFMMISFFIISQITFAGRRTYGFWIRRLVNKIRRNLRLKVRHQTGFFTSMLAYTLLLSIFSIVSFVFFNIYFFILALAFYLNIIKSIYRWVLKRYYKYKRKKLTT